MPAQTNNAASVRFTRLSVKSGADDSAAVHPGCQKSAARATAGQKTKGARLSVKSGADDSAAVHPGCHKSAARATAGQKTKGARPMATHIPASASIGARIHGLHSCARAAASVQSVD